MNIGLVTIYTDHIKELAKITVEYNKRRYCRKHNYDLIIKKDNFILSHYGFEKIRLIIELLKTNKYDWLFWCGSDTLITNFNIKIEDLIDNNYHFIIANDVWDWNADSFLIRNSLEAIGFFEEVLSLKDTYVDENNNARDFGKRLPDGGARAWGEQGVMVDLKEKYATITKEVPQKVLNSYLYKMYPSPWHQKGLDCKGNDGTWSDGDFLVHWPGMSDDLRLQLALQFIPLVKE
jgi:hypothetical protein